jgi:hypothetical protein
VDPAALEPLVRAVVAETIAALKLDGQEEFRRLAGEPTVEPLLMKPPEAARLLGISERTSWEHTAPRGTIPCVPIATAIRYSPKDLRAWIAANRQPAAGPDTAPRPRRSKRTPAAAEDSNRIGCG